MSRDELPMLPDSAEGWLARLHSPACSAPERVAFERWRGADAAHAQAYAQVERLHRIAAGLADDPLLRAAGLAARRRAARRIATRRLLSFTLPPALAAGVLLATGLWFYRGGGEQAPSRHYAGSAGQAQPVLLEDGTRMTLDAGASVTTHFDRTQRLVVLDNGRAEFMVAHMPRPFEVRVGANLIRDIGTTFQVSKDGDAVTVGLLEGKVAVTHGDGAQAQTHTLAPEQQIRIASDGSSVGATPLDLEAAQGWTHGELVFRQRRLDELLEEANRYSSTKLRLGDPALASLLVSGSFHAGDQQALVKALQVGWSLRAEASAAHELTLYPAGDRGRLHAN